MNGYNKHINLQRNKKMEKLSIIIPCYNAEKTIERTINSLTSQDYTNLEIIAINDGSKDNTLEVLNNLAKKDSRIRVYDKPNGGVSTARNLGLSLCTGTLLQFVDSDDYYLRTDSISYLVGLLNKYSVDAVAFNYKHVCFAMNLPEGLYDLEDPVDFMNYYKDFFSFALPWNKIFKRVCLTEPFDETIRFAEDELYNLDNLPNIKRVYISNRLEYNYTCNSSTSAINQTLSDKDLLSSANTIWYKSNRNKSTRDVILQNRYPNKLKKLTDIRSFDYLIYDIEFMCYYDLPEEILASEVMRVCKETDFIKATKRLFSIDPTKLSKESALKFASDSKRLFKDLSEDDKLCNLNKGLIRLYKGLFTPKDN